MIPGSKSKQASWESFEKYVFAFTTHAPLIIDPGSRERWGRFGENRLKLMVMLACLLLLPDQPCKNTLLDEKSRYNMRMGWEFVHPNLFDATESTVISILSVSHENNSFLIKM